MNLIEQLGGYDNAKRIVKDAGYKHRYYSPKRREWHIWSPDDSYICLKDIGKALLEYRRANGIYEVGDKVVRLDNKSLHIYTVQKVESETITIVRKKKSNSVKVWGMWLGCHELRHATDAEIKAGKRGGEDVVHGSTI